MPMTDSIAPHLSIDKEAIAANLPFQVWYAVRKVLALDDGYIFTLRFANGWGLVVAAHSLAYANPAKGLVEVYLRNPQNKIDYTLGDVRGYQTQDQVIDFACEVISLPKN